MSADRSILCIATELASGSVSMARQQQLSQQLAALATETRQARVTLDAIYADTAEAELIGTMRVPGGMQ